MGYYREYHFNGNPGEGFGFNAEDFFGRGKSIDRDEYLRKYLGKGYVDDMNRGKIRSIIWQCYIGGEQNGWTPITLEDIKKDVGVEPKYYNKSFYYVQVENGDYIISSEIAALIFYDHMQQQFVYLRRDGKVFPEDKCIESEEEALKKIRDLHKSKEGKIEKIIWPDNPKSPYKGVYEYKGEQSSEYIENHS